MKKYFLKGIAFYTKNLFLTAVSAVIPTILLMLSFFSENNIIKGLAIFLSVAAGAHIFGTTYFSRKEQKIASNILESAECLCDYQLQEFEKIHFKDAEHTVTEHDINNQINKVLRIVINLFEPNRQKDEDISAVLVYNFNKIENAWKWITENYTSDIMTEWVEDGTVHDGGEGLDSANKLMTDPRSFGYYALKRTYGFTCYNDKGKGVKENHYKLNNRDREVYEETKKYGSIIGLRLNFEIHNEKRTKTKPIQAYLFISTFRKKISDTFIDFLKKEFEKDIEKTILSYYKKILKLELIQLYAIKNRETKNKKTKELVEV